MPAYAVFMRDETVDPVELEQYSAKVDASFDEREVTFSRGLRHDRDIGG